MISEGERIPCRTCGRMSLKNIIEAHDGKCLSCLKAAEYKELQALSKVNISQKVFDAPGMISRSKNKAWRQNTINEAQVIAEVFTERKLATVDLVARFKNKPEHFYVIESELTEIGHAFVKSRLNKWFLNMDRWKEELPRPVNKMKQSLEMQYSKFEQLHS